MIVDDSKLYEWIYHPFTLVRSWGKPIGNISIGDPVYHGNPQGTHQDYQIISE